MQENSKSILRMVMINSLNWINNRRNGTVEHIDVVHSIYFR